LFFTTLLFPSSFSSLPPYSIRGCKSKS
jgi:hypothetical protein